MFDGEQGEIKLYLNGSEIASADLPRGSRLAEAADTDVLIGKNNHSTLLAEVYSLHMFSGMLDELKIYNGALSAEEVAASYRQVLDSHGGVQPQLKYDDIKLDRTPLLADLRQTAISCQPAYH